MKKDTGFSSRETNKGQVREFSEIKAAEKLYEQKTYFKNRLLKKNRHLSKWAAKNSYGAYRVYNRDIPEIPLSVDIYTDFPSGIRYAVVFLYERPYKTSGSEEERWLESMLAILSDTLSIPEDNIFSRIRKKQRGNNQYGKIVDTGSEKTVRPDNEKTPDDFESNSPLAGIQFQKDLEEKAFILGGSHYFAPIQKVEDFLNNQKSSTIGVVIPSYLPGTTLTNLNEILPNFVSSTLKEGIIYFDKRLHGFANPDAILTGIETRSSSPVKIPRNASFISNIEGIYPCGEGAGYAGGIMSAGVDGIKVSLSILGAIF